MIASTQKPSANAVSPLIRSNFPMRIIGRVTTAQDAYVASGIAGSGAERLKGRGDMLAIAGGQSRRFQGAHISEAEISKLVHWLNCRRRSLLDPSSLSAARDIDSSETGEC